MKRDSILSSIDIKKTLVTCLIILVLGMLVVFALVKFKIWTIVAPSDKIFIGLMFIILFSTLGIRYEKGVKKHRK